MVSTPRVTIDTNFEAVLNSMVSIISPFCSSRGVMALNAYALRSELVQRPTGWPASAARSARADQQQPALRPSRRSVARRRPLRLGCPVAVTVAVR